MNFAVENNTTQDFNTYLPVFLYSHASFAEWGESCKVADPKVSGEVNEEGIAKSFVEIDDFFTTVPENMILVDPVPSGLLCMSGHAVDELFPWFISSAGNNQFLKNKLPIADLKKSNIIPSEIDVFQHLYNNRKVYYSRNEVNNYRIAFDTNDDAIPWGIRIPMYNNQKTNNKGNVPYQYTQDNIIINDDDTTTIEMVHTKWSRQYSTARNDQCIYLDEVLKKVREFVDEIYTHKPKILLYLVSCRKQPDYEFIYENDEPFKLDLLNRQLVVDANGRNNVPYGDTTDRKLRNQQTFTYDEEEDDDGSKYQKRLLGIRKNTLKIARRNAKKRRKQKAKTRNGNRKNNRLQKRRKTKRKTKSNEKMSVRKSRSDSRVV
jgi:hypothetical protein